MDYTPVELKNKYTIVSPITYFVVVSSTSNKNSIILLIEFKMA